MAGSGTAALKRSWRRFRRRPAGVQVVAFVVVIAVVAGAVFGITGTSSKKPRGRAGRRRRRHRHGRQRRQHSGLGLGRPSGVSVDQASTSTRGVTATSINVAFPVSNLTSLASNFGFAGDTEFAAQKAAIHTFVNDINDAGGINGRTINPMIVNFDPTNESGMRALCKQWTEGNPAGLRRARRARFLDRRQRALCHPRRPHSLHRAMDDGDQLDPGGRPLPVVDGARPGPDPGHGGGVGEELGPARTTNRIGIVAGDRTSDQVALNQYLLPDLRRAGFTDPLVADPAVEAHRHRGEQLGRARSSCSA